MRHIELQRVAPAEIEARSMEIISAELGERTFPAEVLPVLRNEVARLTGRAPDARQRVEGQGAPQGAQATVPLPAEARSGGLAR